MAIYRGPGGAGDATGDAASEAALASSKAAEAAASANAAASSADAAASSASDASDSADAAAASEASAASYVGLALLKANNLSDLPSASTARTNLGLGTAATTNSTAYATAAQGAKADTALQSYTETDPVYLASSWYITTNNSSNWNTAYGWGNHASAGYATYPSQTGNSGKYLTTNGSATSWATVDALPSQTGNSGKYLTTNGTAASWATLNTDSNSTTKGLYEMSSTISADYSITSGNNAVSAGPVTISSGVTVTVPSGSVWTVV